MLKNKTGDCDGIVGELLKNIMAFQEWCAY